MRTLNLILACSSLATLALLTGCPTIDLSKDTSGDTADTGGESEDTSAEDTSAEDSSDTAASGLAMIRFVNVAPGDAATFHATNAAEGRDWASRTAGTTPSR